MHRLLQQKRNATLECASGDELGDAHNPGSLANIFSPFTQNQLNAETILTTLIYTHAGAKPPGSCWDVRKLKALRALSEISDYHRIRWIYFSPCFFLVFFIDSAHERRLENFTPTGRQISVTFPGWKANTGVIGLCAWLLFLLISCAISLADEKTGRCHRSWRRYHQADARVCQAISY